MRFLKYILIISVMASFYSCTDIENIPVDLPHYEKSDEYYENLREWKSTYKEREIVFGWFGAFTPMEDGYTPTSLLALPDSVDLISIWGVLPRSQGHTDAVQYIRKVKGTKVTYTTFSHNWNLFKRDPNGVPERYDTIDVHSDPEILDPAIEDYAQCLVDSMNLHELDGIDLDQEASGGDIFYGEVNFGKLITALSKSVGPMSGTGKLLIIDGYLDRLPDSCYQMLDYCVTQSYGTGSDASLDSRWNGISNVIPPEKFIVTENYESYFAGGGVSFTDADGNTMQSFEGMARWNPEDGRKGGCGLYHIEYDYRNAPGYSTVVDAIRIMNPKNTDDDETQE